MNATIALPPCPHGNQVKLNAPVSTEVQIVFGFTCGCRTSAPLALDIQSPLTVIRTPPAPEPVPSRWASKARQQHSFARPPVQPFVS